MSGVPLLSDAEMAALREIALSGMQSSVEVWTRSTLRTDDGWEDVFAYSATVDGWIDSTPTPMQTEVSGKVTTVNTYRLFVPVGTAVEPGDHVVSGGKTFIVSDTTSESTWQAMLKVSLRFAE